LAKNWRNDLNILSNLAKLTSLGKKFGENIVYICKIVTSSLRKPVSFDRGLASNLSEVYVWSFEEDACRFDVLG